MCQKYRNESEQHSRFYFFLFISLDTIYYTYNSNNTFINNLYFSLN